MHGLWPPAPDASAVQQPLLRDNGLHALGLLYAPVVHVPDSCGALCKQCSHGQGHGCIGDVVAVVVDAMQLIPGGACSRSSPSASNHNLSVVHGIPALQLFPNSSPLPQASNIPLPSGDHPYTVQGQQTSSLRSAGSAEITSTQCRVSSKTSAGSKLHSSLVLLAWKHQTGLALLCGSQCWAGCQGPAYQSNF